MTCDWCSVFALCFFVCVLLFCFRCAFLFAFCIFVCVTLFLFAFCTFLLALCFFACVFFFCLAMCSFLFAFSLFLWWCVLFCLRFVYFFDDVFFFVCVFFFCLCWPFWATVRTCSMPRQDFFVPYLLPSHVKYYPNSQNFPPFKTGRGKNSVMMTSIVHLSSNRS